jgi:NitT/TauT family transport system ATP-binding protein
MIAGLTEPTSGIVTVDGHNPFRDFNALRGRMAIVFQNDTATLALGCPKRRTRP